MLSVAAVCVLLCDSWLETLVTCLHILIVRLHSKLDVCNWFSIQWLYTSNFEAHWQLTRTLERQIGSAHKHAWPGQECEITQGREYQECEITQGREYRDEFQVKHTIRSTLAGCSATVLKLFNAVVHIIWYVSYPNVTGTFELGEFQCFQVTGIISWLGVELNCALVTWQAWCRAISLPAINAAGQLWFCDWRDKHMAKSTGYPSPRSSIIVTAQQVLGCQICVQCAESLSR